MTKQRTDTIDRFDPGLDAVAVDEPETDIFELWGAITARKRMIAVTTLLFALVATAYVFIATPWYRAEVVLAPAGADGGQDMSSQLGALGGLAGLASLAGIRVGAESNPEAIALLESRGFARDFIESNNLVPILYASDWDAAASRWKTPQDEPDIRDAIEFFQDDIRRVHEDKKTGLVVLTVDWKDAELAASWANQMVARLNDAMRRRALAEAEANVKYLRQELAVANVVALQDSIGSLLERELQKLMLARGNEQFAFRVVDAATSPKRPAHPKRIGVIALAIVVGVIVSVLFGLMQHAKQSRDRRRHRTMNEAREAQGMNDSKAGSPC